MVLIWFLFTYPGFFSRLYLQMEMLLRSSIKRGRVCPRLSRRVWDICILMLALFSLLGASFLSGFLEGSFLLSAFCFRVRIKILKE